MRPGGGRWRPHCDVGLSADRLPLICFSGPCNSVSGFFSPRLIVADGPLPTSPNSLGEVSASAICFREIAMAFEVEIPCRSSNGFRLEKVGGAHPASPRR